VVIRVTADLYAVCAAAARQKRAEADWSV